MVPRRDSNHDTIGQIRFSVAVVNQNRPRDDGRGSDAVVLLNQRFNLVRSQYFERRALRRSGKRVCVFAEVEMTELRCATCCDVACFDD